MSRVKSKNTAPEIRVRRVAHAMGLRFRIHRRDLPGNPDIIFPKYRAAIFIHGCFWHRHLGCKKATMPKSNVRFWEEKFTHNIERDERNIQKLRELGWSVAIFWECEVKDPEEIEKRLCDVLSDSSKDHGMMRE